MDKTSLVIPELKQATQAVKALAHAGLPMTIALAIFNVSARPLTLVIASPDVVKHGPSQVIQFANSIFKAGTTPFTIDDVYFIGPEDSRVRDAVDYFGGQNRHRLGDRPRPIVLRFENDAPQSAFILMFDRRAKASASPLVANKTAIEKAWAA